MKFAPPLSFLYVSHLVHTHTHILIHIPTQYTTFTHTTQVETELQFLGLLVMENPLKGETAGSIAELSSATIPSVMVTGDHALTAIHVSRRCGILAEEGTVGWEGGCAVCNRKKRHSEERLN